MKEISTAATEKKFWKKVLDQGANIGRHLLALAFTLYYCLLDSETPAWARATITAALAYLILPVDAIPDFLPGGYVDDAAALTAAAGAVLAHIKPEHRERAQDQVTALLS